MSTTKIRTDIHRPSAIDPADYVFVGIEYEKTDTIDAVYSLAENRRVIDAHRQATGATYSRHQHGGNCHICGAHAIYTALFHHVPTNTYIRTGFDCAAKLDAGHENEFRVFRDSVKSARKNKAGQMKAQAILADAGLQRAWELSQVDDPTDEPLWKCRDCDGSNWNCDSCGGGGLTTNSHGALCSIVGSLVKYGNLSEKQERFLHKAVNTIDTWPQIKAEREAKRQAERDAAQDCPTGKTAIKGTVLSKKFQENQYGGTLKMLVKDDRGFKVWGSVPSSLQLFDTIERENISDDEAKRMESEQSPVWSVYRDDDGQAYVNVETQRGINKGDRVSFSATVEPSKDDSKFGFYKRPTKALYLSEEKTA